jgi:type I restriction enzyme, S subunit
MDLLGNYVDIILGGTPATSKNEYWGGSIPWASVVDFINDKYLYRTEKTITQKGLDNSNTKLLNIGDIIISARGTVGKMVMCAVPTAFNQSCYALRVKLNETLNQEYLFYLIKYKILELQQVSIGGVFDTIIKSTLENLKFKYVSPQTQQRIASILSAYDELIEVNNQRIKLLEETARELYKEWFVRMRFPGYKKAKFVKGVPEGWAVKKVDDVADVTSSKRIFLSDYVNEGIPFYRGKEISLKSNNESLNDLLYISPTKFKEIKKKFGAPKAGDLLITAVGTIGNIYLVNDSDGDFYFKDGNLIWLRDFENLELSLYFYFYSISDVFTNALDSITIGSSQEALTIASLKKIQLILPNKELIDGFYQIANPIKNQIENLQQQNTQLRQIRDRLLPRLLSGKLAVKRPKQYGENDRLTRVAKG